MNNLVSVSATDLDTILNLNSRVPTANLEAIGDLAIDSLNIYGASLANFAGTPKTVTMTSKERGALLIVVREIYLKFYLKASSGAVSGGFTVTVGDLLNDLDFAGLCEKLGHKLANTSQGVAFSVAEDTSGIE